MSSAIVGGFTAGFIQVLYILSVLMGFSFVMLGLVSIWLINLCKGKVYFDIARIVICALMLIVGTEAGRYIKSSDHFHGNDGYAWSYAFSIIIFLILYLPSKGMGAGGAALGGAAGAALGGADCGC